MILFKRSKNEKCIFSNIDSLGSKNQNIPQIFLDVLLILTRLIYKSL